MIQMVKNLPAGDLSSIPGLGRTLEKEMTTTPVFLPEEFLGQRSLSHGSQKVRHNCVTIIFTFHHKCVHSLFIHSPGEGYTGFLQRILKP